VLRVSEELTGGAWLQLVRSCALHTHHCPNFWGIRLTRCGCSEEYHSEGQAVADTMLTCWDMH